MPTPQQLTALYYDSMREGAFEYSDGPKPHTAEALMARSRALQEGRLRVIAREDEDDQACVGCYAQPPALAGGTLQPLGGGSYQFPRDYTAMPSVPGGFRGTMNDIKDVDRGYFDPGLYKPGDMARPSRPSASLVNGDGQFLDILFDALEVVSTNGTCESDGASCEAGADCKLACVARFVATIISDKPATFPTFTVTGASGLSGNAVPSNISKNGTTNYADYTFEFTKLVPCGVVTKFHLSFVPDSFGGIDIAAAGWTLDIADDDAVWVQLICESCRGSLV